MDNKKCFDCINSDCLINKHISNIDFEILEKSVTFFHFQKNQELLIEDNKGVYILKFGLAKKCTKVKNKHITFSFISNSDIINYAHNVVNQKVEMHDTLSPYHVKFLTESSVCFIEASVFQELLNQQPGLTLAFLFYYADALNKAETKKLIVANSSIETKIASELLVLSDKLKSLPNNYGLLNGITSSEIAEATATSIKTTNKILHTFKNDGIIRKHKRNIQILNVKALEKLVQN